MAMIGLVRDNFTSLVTAVHPGHRRQGIASAMLERIDSRYQRLSRQDAS
ncbi:GNAT family N-acetyltransferase [Paenibacillus sp. FSL R7-0345]